MYIAYQGRYYTIEWYYDDRSRSQALEYFQGVPNERKRKILKLFRFMADHAIFLDITKFRNEGHGIFAFKAGSDRYLCFFADNKRIVVTNAYNKKSQKMPTHEKERALKARKNMQNRIY